MLVGSIRDRAHLVAALLVLLGVAIPGAMMIYGATALGITYKDWTWPALPVTAGLTLGSAFVAGRRPMIGGLLLMVTCAPAATIFWRELGILTFGGAWLLGGWIYFTAARRRLEAPHPDDEGAERSQATPSPGRAAAGPASSARK